MLYVINNVLWKGYLLSLSITLHEKLETLQGEYLSPLYVVKMDKIVRKGSKFETFWVLAVSQKARISQLLFLFVHSASWSLGKVTNGLKLASCVEIHKICELLPLCFLWVTKILSSLEIRGIRLQVDLMQQLAFA